MPYKKIMSNHEFCGRFLHIAEDLKTLYVMGGIGYPLNYKGILRSQMNAYNAKPERRKMIESATPDTFAFDCVCVIKSVLWGFTGDPTKTYGGATYGSNGVPDATIDHIFSKCEKQSRDMSDIAEGEFLRLNSGHCGIYVGNGLVVEATPAWENKVQITRLAQRPWKEHGMLPWIRYEQDTTLEEKYPYPQYTDTELAFQVMQGLFGNGEQRKELLGVRYRAVQDIVNEQCRRG